MKDVLTQLFESCDDVPPSKFDTVDEEVTSMLITTASNAALSAFDDMLATTTNTAAASSISSGAKRKKGNEKESSSGLTYDENYIQALIKENASLRLASKKASELKNENKTLTKALTNQTTKLENAQKSLSTLNAEIRIKDSEKLKAEKAAYKRGKKESKVEIDSAKQGSSMATRYDKCLIIDY